MNNLVSRINVGKFDGGVTLCFTKIILCVQLVFFKATPVASHSCTAEILRSNMIQSCFNFFTPQNKYGTIMV
jgi:hypothetical protein